MVYYGEAVVVFERGGDHERCPTRAILDVRVEFREGGEEVHYIQVGVGAGPVDWQARVRVELCGEFGVRGEEGLYYLD